MDSVTLPGVRREVLHLETHQLAAPLSRSNSCSDSRVKTCGTKQDVVLAQYGNRALHFSE